jgi:DNA-binding GntR family transcriptional regulator
LDDRDASKNPPPKHAQNRQVARARRGGDVIALKQARLPGQDTYEVIKRDIIRCELMPGQITTSAQLMARYGLSHARVRDALNRLSQEHLVEPIQREGYRVAPVTLKQVHDLFGVRLILEPYVASLAAGRVDPRQMSLLLEAGEQLHRADDQDTLEAFVRNNTSFHLVIADASGNEWIVTLMRDLLGQMERVMHLSYLLGGWPSYGHQPHVLLSRALIAGDRDRARDLMEKQLRDVRSFVLDTLVSSPGLQAVNLAAPVDVPLAARPRVSGIPIRMKSTRRVSRAR